MKEGKGEIKPPPCGAMSVYLYSTVMVQHVKGAFARLITVCVGALRGEEITGESIRLGVKAGATTGAALGFILSTS